MLHLVPEHLFVAGLGTEIVGAVLVAIGLVARPQELARRATAQGFNVPSAVAGVKDRIAAAHGLSCLGIGFGIQLTGFLWTFAAGSSELGSAAVAISGAGIAALASAGALASYLLTRRRRVLRLFVETSKVRLYGLDTLAHPQADVLRALGEAFGEPRQQPERYGIERDEAYCQRVFGVHEFEPTYGRPFEPSAIGDGSMSDQAILAAVNREFRSAGVGL